ncbi:MAG: DEAD/DEAH box helicase, partial [Pseudomonadota bacterium]
ELMPATLVYGDPPVLRIDGDRAVLLGKSAPHRKLDEERELVNRLRDELHLVPGRRVDLDGPEAARLLGRIREFQRRLGGALERAIEAPELVARIVIDGDRFDVVFETEEAGGTPRRADAAAVLHAYRDGLELTPLLDGGFGAIPKDFLARYGDRLADLLAARRPDGSVQPAAMLDLGALAAELDLPRPGTLDKLAPLVEGFDAIPSAPLPPGLRAELRSYQRRGVDWLSFLRDAGLGGVLADDMGLGKTLQALCVLRGRSLVICPKSVVYNWAAEIQRFRPDLSVAIYHGARRELDERADVTLTTYAVLRLDVERLAERRWDVVVLDEAQAIKNPESQTARAAFALSADFRLALSGTPVENRLDELWSVMHFANPGLLGGRSDFQTRFAEPLTRGDGAVAERLRARIRPFVLRRHKRDVLPELPPRTDALLYVELDEAERAVYDAVRAATKQEIVERLAAGGSVLAALEALLRLRQAACHVGLVPGQSREGSSKVERLLGALEDAVADGHKALVFSQWTSLLDRVEPHLREAGISFTRLDGSTRDRAGVVAEFQNPAGPPVLLISLKAGGTGLNLTAADHVFLLDPWWNPAVEEQAADRAHRIGQDRPVMVYRLVAKDTVEERMLELQRAKRSLAEAALGEADRAVGITREDLLRLLD